MSGEYSLLSSRFIPTQDDYDQLSLKAATAIGAPRIAAMSNAQINLLNQSLDRILKRRGSVCAVTDLELIGAYEMIVDHVLPDYVEAALAQAKGLP